jgi:hypothetical protein
MSLLEPEEMDRSAVPADASSLKRQQKRSGYSCQINSIE